MPRLTLVSDVLRPVVQRFAGEREFALGRVCDVFLHVVEVSAFVGLVLEIAGKVRVEAEYVRPFLRVEGKGGIYN